MWAEPDAWLLTVLLLLWTLQCQLSDLPGRKELLLIISTQLLCLLSLFLLILTFFFMHLSKDRECAKVLKWLITYQRVSLLCLTFQHSNWTRMWQTQEGTFVLLNNYNIIIINSRNQWVSNMKLSLHATCVAEKNIYLCVCTSKSENVHTYIYIYVNIYTHLCMYIYIHVYKYIFTYM